MGQTFAAVFPTFEQAQGFVGSVIRDPRSAQMGHSLGIGGRANASGIDFFTNNASAFGGHITRSTHRREQVVYQYQDHITLQDRRYLALRDPTAKLIIEQPAYDTWSALPMAFDATADNFFDILTRLNFQKSIVGADISQRRDGGAFLYINASGDVSQPIQPGDKIFGFDFITMDQIPSTDATHVDIDGDPGLLQHGIKFLEFYPTPEHRNRGEPITVHGSRIVSMVEDAQARWWHSRSALDPIYDDLWNFRDVIFAQKQSQFMGNPIKVEVDIENGFDIDDDEADEVQKRISDLRSGHRDSITPVQGLMVSRLGPPNLDDPDAIVRALASRIANGTVFPVNMILASSRGSEQVTDQDFITYESNIDKRRRVYCFQILNQLFKVFQKAGLMPRRAVLPTKLRWDALRILNVRDEALAWGNYTKILKSALESGRKPPAWIDSMFPENEAVFDPEKILPKGTGRDPTGADPRSNPDGDDDDRRRDRDRDQPAGLDTPRYFEVE